VVEKVDAVGEDLKQVVERLDRVTERMDRLIAGVESITAPALQVPDRLRRLGRLARGEEARGTEPDEPSPGPGGE
jgi:hypothetical protein